MRAELLDIDGDRRGQALRTQHVEPRRRAVGLVNGDSWCFALALLEVTRGGLF